jgi:Family of unknown function (DUF5719)
VKFARPLMVTVLAASVGGLAWADRHPVPSAAPVLAGAGVLPMAAIPTTLHLSTSWYCPGVPAGNMVGASGSFTIANTSESEFSTRLTLFPVGKDPVVSTIVVPARGRKVINPAETAPSTMAAALIEMSGAVGAVEQTATSQEGVSVSACVLEPSPNWYLADGSTRSDSSMSLTLFNPSPTDAVVDLAFADEENARVTKKFEGRVVPARSLVVLDISQVILRKERLSVAATVRSGSLVMGRFQVFRGDSGSRRGFMVGAAAPALSTEWRFASGQKGDGGPGTLPASTRVIVHNPGTSDATVFVTSFPATPEPVAPPNAEGTPPATGPAAPDPIRVVVGARQSYTVDLNADQVPTGLFSMVVTSDEPIVVERALDRTQNNVSVATLQMGSPLSAGEWHFAAGAPEGTQSTLQVVNATGLPGKVTVKALGAAGLVAVPGWESVALAEGALIRFDLGEKNVSADSIVVTSTVDVVVERVIRGANGWSSALGLPVAGP